MKVSNKLLLALMMVLAVALLSGKAFAQVALIDDFTCAILDANPDYPAQPLSIENCDPGLKGNRTHAVLTPSGNVIMKCNCKIPLTATSIIPDKTEMIEGFKCITPHGETFDSRSVVTKSGRSNLTCVIHPSP